MSGEETAVHATIPETAKPDTSSARGVVTLTRSDFDDAEDYALAFPGCAKSSAVDLDHVRLGAARACEWLINIAMIGGWNPKTAGVDLAVGVLPTEADKTDASAEGKLRKTLYALRQRAAEEASDGPSGKTLQGRAMSAYEWLGDAIDAFVAEASEAAE